jgi:amino acid adenylation domain-containing protein
MNVQQNLKIFSINHQQTALIKDVTTFTLNENIKNKMCLLINNKWGDENKNENLYIVLISTLKTLMHIYSDQNDHISIVEIFQVTNKLIVENFIIEDTMTFENVLDNTKKYFVEKYDMKSYFWRDIVNTDKEEALRNILCFNNKNNFMELIYSDKNDHFINIVVDEKIKFEVIYSINKIKNVEVNNFFKLYFELIDKILNNYKVKVEDISFDTSQYYKFNYDIRTKSSDNSIVNIFDRIASNNLNIIAVCDDYNSYTYEELRTQSIMLANYILGNYVIKKKRVGILMERSTEYVISILAVLRIGCAYIPIEKNFPKQRKEYIIEDSELDLILTKYDLEEIKYKVKSLDIMSVNLSDSKEIYVDVKSDDLAYIMYTSGTTGNPKGVMISHKSVVNLKKHFDYDLKINPQDKVGQFASISFDASVSEIFMAILTGATLYFIDDKYIGNYKLFEECLNRNKITVITLPPTFLINIDSNKIMYLRLLLSAGSQISISLAKVWGEKLELVNAYGPTECTVCATTWHYEKHYNFFENVPIGRAIPSVRVYVTGKKGQLLPPMIVGEICIGGSSVGRGYLNNDRLNAEKFIKDIFQPNEVMYRTGDYGKLLLNGDIEFCGRKDDQVKVRGYRIELDEIRNLLLKVEGISDAAVIVIKDDFGKEFICAYVICLERNLTSMQIKEKLKNKMPTYLLPNFIIPVERFYLNSSGKVNKDALPNAFDIVYQAEESNFKNDISEFEDEILKDITEMWKKILSINHISKESSFFELGGHSLTVINLITEIYKKYNINITINDVYKNETLTDLYSFCKRLIREKC